MFLLISPPAWLTSGNAIITPHVFTLLSSKGIYLYRHDMGNFSPLLACCGGNPPSPLDCAHKRSTMRSIVVSLGKMLNKEPSYQLFEIYRYSCDDIVMHQFMVLWFDEYDNKCIYIIDWHVNGYKWQGMRTHPANALVVNIRLTHWGQVMHICIGKLTNHHWFRKWLVAWSVPSHYQNQCWNIDNWNLRNKLQWNLKWNSYIFIQENAFENVVWKMAAILSRPQCVKHMVWLSHDILYVPDIYKEVWL